MGTIRASSIFYLATLGNSDLVADADAGRFFLCNTEREREKKPSTLIIDCALVYQDLFLIFLRAIKCSFLYQL